MRVAGVLLLICTSLLVSELSAQNSDIVTQDLSDIGHENSHENGLGRWPRNKAEPATLSETVGQGRRGGTDLIAEGSFTMDSSNRAGNSEEDELGEEDDRGRRTAAGTKCAQATAAFAKLCPDTNASPSASRPVAKALAATKNAASQLTIKGFALMKALADDINQSWKESRGLSDCETKAAKIFKLYQTFNKNFKQCRDFSKEGFLTKAKVTLDEYQKWVHRVTGKFSEYNYNTKWSTECCAQSGKSCAERQPWCRSIPLWNGKCPETKEECYKSHIDFVLQKAFRAVDGDDLPSSTNKRGQQYIHDMNMTLYGHSFSHRSGLLHVINADKLHQFVCSTWTAVCKEPVAGQAAQQCFTARLIIGTANPCAECKFDKGQKIDQNLATLA